MSWAGHAINAKKSYAQNRKERNSQRTNKSNQATLPSLELNFDTSPLSEEKKQEIALKIKKERQKSMVLNRVFLALAIAILTSLYFLLF